MARSRSIKPGFFKNEDLAECSAWARLCFAGLWTQADRAGRLEDRPKRIKGEVFPFDTVDVEPLLNELAHWGFVLRYEANGKRFIQILKFAKHQNPHQKEPASVIPSPESLGLLPCAKDGKPETAPPSHDGEVSDKSDAGTGHSGQESQFHEGKTLLTPDSLLPITDSSNKANALRANPKHLRPETFEPNANCIALAKTHGLDLATELDAFKNHHDANGSKFADWQAAFRKWLGNSLKFAKDRSGRTTSNRHNGLTDENRYADLKNGEINV